LINFNRTARVGGFFDNKNREKNLLSRGGIFEVKAVNGKMKLNEGID
jgi:hypothetical protein